MRSLLAACALLVLGTAAAEAQPFWGYGGPHAYGYGYGWRHPHPYGGWRGGPRWGGHCFWVRGYYGPHRVCRGW